MNNRLLDLHLYLSLLCAPYLVVYGISTLSFNHSWAWIRPAEETHVWQQEAALPDGDTDLAIATELRDSLGLIGYVVPWRLQISADEVSFAVWRPGKSYEIARRRESDTVSVTETRVGFWGVMRDLHGLGSLPGSALGWMWRWYTLTSVGALVFAVFSGIYLWWSRLPSRRRGLHLLLWGSGSALVFMLYIVW